MWFKKPRSVQRRHEHHRSLLPWPPSASPAPLLNSCSVRFSSRLQRPRRPCPAIPAVLFSVGAEWVTDGFRVTVHISCTLLWLQALSQPWHSRKWCFYLNSQVFCHLSSHKITQSEPIKIPFPWAFWLFLGKWVSGDVVILSQKLRRWIWNVSPLIVCVCAGGGASGVLPALCWSWCLVWRWGLQVEGSRTLRLAAWNFLHARFLGRPEMHTFVVWCILMVAT